nr:unnamed protein product [Callosobruchus chinensis]
MLPVPMPPGFDGTSIQFLESLDNGVQTYVIYTDLTKAFDSKDHKLVILKLAGMDLSNDLYSTVAMMFFDNRFSGVRGIIIPEKGNSTHRWPGLNLPSAAVFSPARRILLVTSHSSTDIQADSANPS